MSVLLNLSSALALFAIRAAERLTRPDRGQSVTEYALLLIGVAALAALVLKWAGGTDLIGRLFNSVFNKVIGGAG